MSFSPVFETWPLHTGKKLAPPQSTSQWGLFNYLKLLRFERASALLPLADIGEIITYNCDCNYVPTAIGRVLVRVRVRTTLPSEHKITMAIVCYLPQFPIKARLCLSRAVGKTGFQLVMTLPQLFFLFVARVSGVTLLAGPVAKKKKQ